jgi:predicted nucleotidyltransferase component of viral defense system
LVELETIELIAADLGVGTSFIEKDWYAMRIIAALLTVNNPDFRLVFSGGTSLSKGFGLIKRFSEDIDFKAIALTPSNRNKRGQWHDLRSPQCFSP